MRILKRLSIAVAACGICLSGAVSQEAQPSGGAWQLACSPAEEGSTQVCELRQRVANQQGQEILRLAFGAAGEQGREVALRTPQGVLLTTPVELAPLEGEAIVAVPYRTCINRICIARALMTEEETTLLADATQPAVRFRDRSGRVIRVIVSVEGLAEGLAALDAR